MKKRKHIVNLRYEAWLQSRYRLIAGADGEDDPGPADGGPDPDPPLADPDPADPADPDPADPDPDPADADEDELERIKKERDEARDRVARAEAAAQKAKQEARRAREEAAKKGGNWEQVAKERESELADANERATAAEQRAVKAEDELDSFRREVRITRIATKLSFRDTADAVLQLAGQPENTGDDKSCERALRDLIKKKPYLIDERRARGRAMSGTGNGNNFLTKEQMEKMTPDEINAAWEKGQIQSSLANLTPNTG